MREDFSSEEISLTARQCIETGLFYSMDLYSDENVYPPETFKSLFKQAKNSGMKLKAHAGEFGDAEQVRHTVEVLELEAVQHGIGAADSPEVMKWLSRNRIMLNICPTSNVMLGAVDSLGSHPLRKLFDHGVSVSINTDDLMIFGQSVSEEYLNLYRAGVFSAQELDGIREAALTKAK
jgi:adenosine deaminase